MEKLSTVKTKYLTDLGAYLKLTGYRFTTPTPESHRIILNRSTESQTDEPLAILRDLFGWNKWVNQSHLPKDLNSLLDYPELIINDGGLIKSKYRVGTLNALLFFHSAFPTEQKNSVFFGPDSYRFAHFINSHLKPCNTLLDIGCGTGVGGIYYRDQLLKNGFSAPKLSLSDINLEALELASVNCSLNNVKDVEILESDLFSQVTSDTDLVIANPPFIIDPSNRKYRDGGNQYGTGFSLKLVDGFLKNIQRPSTLFLYTGSSIVNGTDIFLKNLTQLLMEYRCKWDYVELDPDIFGEQLRLPEYRAVERIAAIGLYLEQA